MYSLEVDVAITYCDKNEMLDTVNKNRCSIVKKKYSNKRALDDATGTLRESRCAEEPGKDT